MKKLMQRVLCIMLISMLVASNVLPTYDAKADNGYHTYSPLLDPAVPLDKVNPYELECLAVYLSNFCIPFVDSMNTALTPGCGIGSDGGGRNALTFSSGGDASTMHNLDNMLKVILGTDYAQSTTPLMVELYEIKGNSVQKLGGETGDAGGTTSFNDSPYRVAVLKDLFPLIQQIATDSTAAQADMSAFANADITNLITSSKTDSVGLETWIAGVSSDNISASNTGQIKASTYHDFRVTCGVLGRFYVNTSNNSLPTEQDKGIEIIYDQLDSWDIQIPAQLALYTAYKDGGKHEPALQELLTKYAEKPLFIDRIGNIIIENDEHRGIIIIPACLNQHITNNNTINLLTAPIVNTGFTTEGTEVPYGLLSCVTGSLAVHSGSDKRNNTMLNAGIGTAERCSTRLDGVSFIYNNYYDSPNNFIDTGIDTQKLRWSTALGVKNSSESSGFDINNYLAKLSDCNDNTGGFKVNDIGDNTKQVTYTLAKPINFNHAKTTAEILSQANSAGEINMYYGMLQISSQCIAAYLLQNVSSNNHTVVAYFKQLKGNLEPRALFNMPGDNSNTKTSLSSDIKSSIIIPIGYSSYAREASAWFIFGDGSDQECTNVDKQGYISAKSFYKDNGHEVNTGYYATKILAADMIKQKKINIGLRDSNRMFKWNNDDTSPLKLYTAGNGTTSMFVSKYLNSNESDDKLNKIDNDTNIVYSDIVSNAAKIIPKTAVLDAAAGYLGLIDSSSFSAFASDMYYTYLDIYGFSGTQGVGSGIFNKNVLAEIGNNTVSMSQQAFQDMLDTTGVSSEQKEEEMKENAYKMLDPGKEGKEYRRQVLSSTFEGWLIDSYDKICYGNTESEYYATMTSTRHSFVNLDTYADNFMTKAVVARWPIILPVLMLLLSIFIMVFATINNKRVLWIVVNLITTACMLITLPAVTEIAPYVVEKVSDSALKSVMYTAAMNEALEAKSIEQDVNNMYSQYSEEIRNAIAEVNAMGTSGSLLLKQDITRKAIVRSTNARIAELKGLATARWLLPTILSMSGATDEADSDNYIFVSLGEKRAELRSFDMQAALSAGKDYDKILKLVELNNVEQANIDTLIGNNDYFNMFIDDLRDNGVRNTIDNPTGNPLTINAVTYVQGTESVLPYFYINAHKKLCSLASSQGNLTLVTMQQFYDGIKHDTTHTNILTVTRGNVKDCGNLRTLLTDYVPYLLRIQDNAVKNLGKRTLKFDEYETYEGKEASFLFRCNWADKLVRNSGYDEDDINPNKYMEKYGREMIFSRAEMVSAGLTTKDLTPVEIKCIEVNDRIDTQWTLLVNYINTEGIDMELIAEHMAIVSTIAFNEVFTKDRLVNANLALYPSAISLRTINYDTMMKLVLMSNYGYVDSKAHSMEIVLAESGWPSGLLLVVLAWVITVAVPFIMSLTLGFAFYAAILACAYNAVVNGKDKMKVFGGAAISVFAIIIYTSLYILSFKWVIGNTNKILSLDDLASGDTVAVGKLLLIAIFTAAYLVALIFRMIHTIRNFRDMGFQMWATVAKKSFDGFQNMIKSIKNHFSSGSDKSESTTASGDSDDSVGKTEVQGDVSVKNVKDDPLYIQDVTEAANSATWIQDDDDVTELDSGYVAEDAPDDVTTSDSSSNNSNSSSNNSEQKDDK